MWAGRGVYVILKGFSLGTLCTFLAGERERVRKSDTHVQNGDVEANTCSEGESNR